MRILAIRFKKRSEQCVSLAPKIIKIGLLQFVVLKPALTMITFVLDYKEPDLYDPWLIIRALNFIVTVVALGCLLFTYRNTRTYLSNFNPLLKFGVFKLLVFVCLIQGIILNFLVRNDQIDEDLAINLESTLTLLEMFPLSIAIFRVFPFSDLRESNFIQVRPADRDPAESQSLVETKGDESDIDPVHTYLDSK